MGWLVSITPRPSFTPGERTPGTHCTGGWVGPRAGLDTEVRGKILCPCRGPNPDRPIFQPVVRHYTAWANPAPYLKYNKKQLLLNTFIGHKPNAFRSSVVKILIYIYMWFDHQAIRNSSAHNDVPSTRWATTTVLNEINTVISVNRTRNTFSSKCTKTKIVLKKHQCT
jgi:hypothetical protein